MGQLWSTENEPDVFYGNHEVSGFDEELDSSTTESVRTGEQKTALDTCEKMFNGHRDMIPIREFTRDSLPEPYNTNETVYKLTKALAYLTVRITIKRVSQKRPQFLPGKSKENHFYPMHEKRGKSFSTYVYNGTGRVCDVIAHKLFTTCTCETCKDSPNPSKECWTIKVFTATHVVFDTEEASDAKCSLFHGDKNRTRLDIRGFKKIWSDTGGDLCLLSTVICNKDLSEKLFKKIKVFNTYWGELRTLKEKDNHKERLVIIVSHPHGYEKRISIGFGLDIGRLEGMRYSKFVYNAPTCPGTSGAPVYILGIDWRWLEYVHGGANSNITEIDNLLQKHPEMLKLFPSCLDNPTATLISFSSCYEPPTEQIDETESEKKQENENQKWKILNYSAKWY